MKTNTVLITTDNGYGLKSIIYNPEKLKPLSSEDPTHKKTSTPFFADSSINGSFQGIITV
jgi:hypothetical protein